MTVSLLTLVAVLLACAVGPGLLVVRTMRWRCSPLERLCAAVAVSLVLVYAAALLVYIAGGGRSWYWMITVAAGAATVVAGGELRRMWRNHQVRRAVLATATLAAWSLLLLCLVRNYGGGWYGDWYEHYERTLFFLDRWPRESTFLEGLYTLPARPPMMNLIAAHLLAHVGVSGGDRYAAFQVACTLLGAMAFLPCALAATLFSRRRTWLLAAVLACNPMFVQNATYSWPRLLCAFYVIFGIWLYLRGWRKRDGMRMAAAVGSLAAGTVVHYSAGPYVVALALHYLVAVAPRRRTALVAREVVGGAAIAVLVLGPWLGWSMSAYGVGATFGDNSTVTDAATLSRGGAIKAFADNLVWTLVPHPLRGMPHADFSRANTFAGFTRDYWAKVYHNNLFIAFGTAGALLVPVLMARRLLSRSMPPALFRFWLWLVLATVALGIATHPRPSPWGMAHISLQPLIYLGLTVLAVSFHLLPPLARWFAVAGVTVDFMLGVLLHFVLQNARLEWVADDVDPHGRVGLGIMVAMNLELKLQSGVSLLADHVRVPPALSVSLMVVGFLAAAAVMVNAARLKRIVTG